MEYIIYKDFNTKAICGEVNLPTGTVCNEYSGYICHEGKALCINRSENAFQYFARNDDGNGLKRGELIRTIKDTLIGNDEAWERVLEDTECAKFNRNGDGDTWLWNFDFYNAAIEELERIAELVKG